MRIFLQQAEFAEERGAVSQVFLTRLRKGASDNECQMKPRKVRSGSNAGYTGGSQSQEDGEKK